MLEGWGCIGKEGEEKLHHYIIFVTKLLKFRIMYFITIINKMRDEEVKNLKFDFS